VYILQYLTKSSDKLIDCINNIFNKFQQLEKKSIPELIIQYNISFQSYFWTIKLFIESLVIRHLQMTIPDGYRP